MFDVKQKSTTDDAQLVGPIEICKTLILLKKGKFLQKIYLFLY